MKEKKCPACKKGILSLRNGAHGAFLGCDRYPSCRYTESISGAAGTSSKEDVPVTGELVKVGKERLNAAFAFVEAAGSVAKAFALLKAVAALVDAVGPSAKEARDPEAGEPATDAETDDPPY